MRFAVFLIAVCLCTNISARTHHKPSSARASSSKLRSSRTKGATASSHGKRGRRRTAHNSAPRYQSAPTTDRYKEIQQALADKGYYKGNVNGEWDSDSVDALKRFQTDQKLQADGRINSLSLKAMGLGAKRAPLAVVTPPTSNP